VAKRQHVGYSQYLFVFHCSFDITIGYTRYQTCVHVIETFTTLQDNSLIDFNVMKDYGGTHAHNTGALGVREQKKKKRTKKHPHSETLCDWTKSLFQTKTEHADWL